MDEQSHVPLAEVQELVGPGSVAHTQANRPEKWTYIGHYFLYSLYLHIGINVPRKVSQIRHVTKGYFYDELRAAHFRHRGKVSQRNSLTLTENVFERDTEAARRKARGIAAHPFPRASVSGQAAIDAAGDPSGPALKKGSGAAGKMLGYPSRLPRGRAARRD